jgi:GGDEF domain-containing protein
MLLNRAAAIKSFLALEDLRRIRVAGLSHAFLWLMGALGILITRGRCQTRPPVHVWPSSLQRFKSLDPTINLPNEIIFKERTGIAVDLARLEGKYVAVAFVAPIRLAEVSHAMGYDASKELVWAIGQRLKEALRDNDTVAQVENSGIKILLGSLADPSDAQLVARKMFDAFAIPFNINEDYYYVGVNIGLSVYPIDARDATDLMSHANEALKQSQQDGRPSFEIYRL